MATVGNLFVNVRGRTGGLVRDLKKANNSVTKDFYRNEAMALQNVRKSRGAFMQAFRATPERKRRPGIRANAHPGSGASPGAHGV